MKSFFVGLDLGQQNDYTAICIVERIIPEGEPGAEMVLPCRHLDRFRHVPYPDVVDRVLALLEREPLKGSHTELVVDCTGVGDAVGDLFRRRGRSFRPVKIHGGDTERRSEDGVYRVPKRNLISDLLVAFQNDQFKTVSSLEHAETLLNELVNFKQKINIATGHESFEAWREGIHDDLVLAASLAVWGGLKYYPTPALYFSDSMFGPLPKTSPFGDAPPGYGSNFPLPDYYPPDYP